MPIFVKKCITKVQGDYDIEISSQIPTFSSVYFASSLSNPNIGGGINIKTKDQDFSMSRKLYLQSSYDPQFNPLKTVKLETHLGYVLAEMKTNLDKTMFQEASATAHDIKQAVTGAKYYLLCDFLDMTPISTTTTDIDEILIVRKAKRICITSNGKIYENPKIIRKYERQLVKLQRQLSHKEKRSKNYYKTKKKIALCHEKIRNTRKDYLHKVSHEIISENQVVVSENLQIKNMVKNYHLAKSISDVSWYELTRQLEYKAKWNGRKYIKIDPFYASSQICSVCGYKNPDIKDLSVRAWICPECGAEHDRDINAAKNILAEGLGEIG